MGQLRLGTTWWNKIDIDNFNQFVLNLKVISIVEFNSLECMSPKSVLYIANFTYSKLNMKDKSLPSKENKETEDQVLINTNP